MKEITSIEDYRQIAGKIAKEESQVGDKIRLRVISDSMAPLLKVGDTVIVFPNSPAALRRGDVIVVWRNEEFITHGGSISQYGSSDKKRGCSWQSNCSSKWRCFPELP